MYVKQATTAGEYGSARGLSGDQDTNHEGYEGNGVRGVNQMVVAVLFDSLSPFSLLISLFHGRGVRVLGTKVSGGMRVLANARGLEVEWRKVCSLNTLYPKDCLNQCSPALHYCFFFSISFFFFHLIIFAGSALNTISGLSSGFFSIFLFD